MPIKLMGGPADGATVKVGPDDCRIVVVVDPDGSTWHFDDDRHPPPHTGVRYYYRASDGRLDEVHPFGKQP